MKKLLLFTMLVLGGSIMTGIQAGQESAQDAPKVYICQGSKSACYHSNPNCSGLRRCSTELKAITLDEAKKMGRRPCKVCCK